MLMQHHHGLGKLLADIEQAKYNENTTTTDEDLHRIKTTGLFGNSGDKSAKKSVSPRVSPKVPKRSSRKKMLGGSMHTTLSSRNSLTNLGGDSQKDNLLSDDYSFDSLTYDGLKKMSLLLNKRTSSNEDLSEHMKNEELSEHMKNYRWQRTNENSELSKERKKPSQTGRSNLMTTNFSSKSQSMQSLLNQTRKLNMDASATRNPRFSNASLEHMTNFQWQLGENHKQQGLNQTRRQSKLMSSSSKSQSLQSLVSESHALNMSSSPRRASRSRNRSSEDMTNFQWSRTTSQDSGGSELSKQQTLNRSAQSKLVIKTSSRKSQSTQGLVNLDKRQHELNDMSLSSLRAPKFKKSASSDMSNFQWPSRCDENNKDSKQNLVKLLASRKSQSMQRLVNQSKEQRDMNMSPSSRMAPRFKSTSNNEPMTNFQWPPRNELGRQQKLEQTRQSNLMNMTTSCKSHSMQSLVNQPNELDMNLALTKASRLKSTPNDLMTKNFQWQSGKEHHRESELSKQQKLSQTGRSKGMTSSRKSLSLQSLANQSHEPSAIKNASGERMTNFQWPRNNEYDGDSEMPKQHQKMNQSGRNKFLIMASSRKSKSVPRLMNQDKESCELNANMSSTLAPRFRRTSSEQITNFQWSPRSDKDQKARASKSLIVSASRKSQSMQNPLDCNTVSDGSSVSNLFYGDKLSDEYVVASSPRRVSRFRAKAVPKQQLQQPTSSKKTVLASDNDPASDNFKDEINKLASSLSNYYTPRAKKPYLGGNFSSDDDDIKIVADNYAMSRSEHTPHTKRFEACPSTKRSTIMCEELDISSEDSNGKTNLGRSLGPRSRIRTHNASGQRPHLNKFVTTSTVGIRSVVRSSSLSDLRYLKDSLPGNAIYSSESVAGKRMMASSASLPCQFMEDNEDSLPYNEIESSKTLTKSYVGKQRIASLNAASDPRRFVECFEDPSESSETLF